MDWMKEKLGDGLFNTVMEKLGDNSVLPNDGKYIPISKFNEINEKNKLYQEQLKVLEGTSLQFEEMTRTNSKLSEQYNLLKQETTKQIEQKEKEMLNILKRGKLKDILASNEALYPDLLMSQIDIDYIKMEGDSLQGFNIEDLKTKFPQMFKITNIETNVNTENVGNKSVFSKQATKKSELIEQYNKAEKEKNFVLCNSIMRQIKELS